MALVPAEHHAAQPFLKWAGGKGALIGDLVRHAGARVLTERGRYFEPFAGGAALFWRLDAMDRRPGAVLSDANEELVTCYRAIRDNVEDVIVELAYKQELYTSLSTKNRAALYYRVRDSRSPDAALSAARMIFLNKTGFNGLYRVNRKGEFNVPHGRTASGKPPVICDAENLRACSKALRGVKLLHQDFRSTVNAPDRHDAPQAGDLVYLDPPYEPEPGKASFTAYTAGGASATLQEDVASTFRELAAREVYVVASNSATPRIRELYRGFKQIELARPGGMNSDPAKRGKVKELLMLGWERT